MKADNTIKDKSLDFAIRIVRLYKHISETNNMLLVDPAKDMGGIPELAAERIAELRRMAAELRQPRNYVERLEFSVSAERGSVKTVPTDYAKGFLPASAPEAKVVRATVGFSDAVQRANGSGSELRFRKTAAAEITLK